MGIKQLYNDNLRKLRNEYGDVPVMCTNFKILGAVAPDKSLTQISLCITLEWEIEKRIYGKRRQN